MCQPAVSPVNAKSALLANWCHVQVALDRLWMAKRIPTGHHSAGKPVRVEDLVIVVDEPRRNSWERGVILEVHPGKDGRIRNADDRTKGGVLLRPVTKLAVLDVLDQPGMAEGRTSSNTGRGMCATVQDPSLSATAIGSTDPTID